MNELLRALGALAEPPGAETERLAELLELSGSPSAADWTRMFVLELPPYASVYLGPEGMIGGAARDRVAAVWRALGSPPPREPDQLTALLSLYARLAESPEPRAEPARRTLLHEHLASWLPLYLAAASEVAPPVYRRWAELLAAAISAETEALGPGDRAPLHFREAPPLEAPWDVGLDGFVRQLLTPVRSGLILTRSDLARAAGELGLGLRLGERRLALRSLLEHDAAGMLAWLAGTAAARSRRPLGDFWRRRLRACAALLSECGVAAAAAVRPAAR